jgi:hypothetical protein
MTTKRHVTKIPEESHTQTKIIKAQTVPEHPPSPKVTWPYTLHPSAPLPNLRNNKTAPYALAPELARHAQPCIAVLPSPTPKG